MKPFSPYGPMARALFGPKKKPGYAVSAKTRAAVIERDGRSCFYCQDVLELDAITMDHIIPKTRGGSGEAHNLRVCCQPCNSAKGNRTAPYPDYFERKRACKAL